MWNLARAGRERRGRAAAVIAGGMVGLWLVAMLWATLSPQVTHIPAEQRHSLCLICGDRGAADALLNVVLFAPLGVFLWFRGMRLSAAALLGMVLSGSIELAQLLVATGRHANLGDVVWNTSGVWCGAALSTVVARSLTDSGRLSPGAAPLLATILGGTVLLAGYALDPAPTSARYWGQWTPRLGHLVAYDGTLIRAELDGEPIPPRAYPLRSRVRQSFEGDWTVTSTVVKGTPPPSLSPIVSIYDEEQKEIFLLGADGDDVVLRERLRASDLRMEHVGISLPGALRHVAVGDTVRLGARRQGGFRCISVDGAETCGLTWGSDQVWKLVLGGSVARDGSGQSVDAAFFALLFLLVGLASGSVRSLALGGAVLSGAVLIAPTLTRLQGPTVFSWLAASVALVGGGAFITFYGGWIQRRRHAASDSIDA